MVAFHCVTCVGCTVYSRANCETVLSPTRASNPTLALKAALCRLRFAFISLLFLIYSRPTKVHLNPWSNFWGPSQGMLIEEFVKTSYICHRFKVVEDEQDAFIRVRLGRLQYPCKRFDRRLRSEENTS